MINYIVIEGSHKNPNEMSTLDENTKKEHGPFMNKDEAESLAKSLIQKRIGQMKIKKLFKIYLMK